MQKITIKPFHVARRDFWKAYIGDTWDDTQALGIGGTPSQALGSLVAAEYQALGIAFSGPEAIPGDIPGALGGIIRANAAHFELEIEIREE